MTAYLLVTHGSRDPRPQVEAGVLARLVSEQLQAATLPTSVSPKAAATVGALPLVGTAVLELHPLPLHQQIQQFAEQAIATGHSRLLIVPLFLLPGVHVLEDLPAEVAIAQSLLPSSFTLDSCLYLGSYPPLKQQLKQLLPLNNPSPPSSQQILLSHGSRRPGGNAPVEAIAAELNATPAYWSTAPKLEDQVRALVDHGNQQIEILPYFLFEGKITDAIGQSVADLAHQYPAVSLQLAKPLGATPALAKLIVELLQSATVMQPLAQ